MPVLDERASAIVFFLGKTPLLPTGAGGALHIDIVLAQGYKGQKTLGGKTRIRRVDQGVQVEK